MYNHTYRVANFTFPFQEHAKAHTTQFLLQNPQNPKESQTVKQSSNIISLFAFFGAWLPSNSWHIWRGAMLLNEQPSGAESTASGCAAQAHRQGNGQAHIHGSTIASMKELVVRSGGKVNNGVFRCGDLAWLSGLRAW